MAHRSAKKSEKQPEVNQPVASSKEAAVLPGGNRGGALSHGAADLPRRNGMVACPGATMVGSDRRSVGSPRRRLLLAAIFCLIAGLVVVLVVGASYAGLRDQLPPLTGVTSNAQPRFLYSMYGVTRPLGVAVSPVDGRVYVTESDGSRETKIFDRKGSSVGALVPPDADSGSRMPVYVAVNKKGHVYVSDRARSLIDMFGPDGTYLGRFAPNGDSQFAWSPLGVSFDGEDRLIVTDVTGGQHRVIIFSPDGQLLAQFGKEGQGDNAFAFPNAAVAGPRGTIIVSDGNNGRVITLSFDGQKLSPVGGAAGEFRMGLPRGLGMDANDRLYAVDAINHGVTVYDLAPGTPALLFNFGAEGVKDGEFLFPNGLAVQVSEGDSPWRGRDRIYVTDRENNRVQAWGY